MKCLVWHGRAVAYNNINGMIIQSVSVEALNFFFEIAKCLGWTFRRTTITTSMHSYGRGTRRNPSPISKTDKHLHVDQPERQGQFRVELYCQRRSSLVEFCSTSNDYDPWCYVGFAANQKRWPGMVKYCLFKCQTCIKLPSYLCFIWKIFLASLKVRKKAFLFVVSFII